jgi:hypothetical protein
MDHQNALAGFGIVMFVVAFFPAVVALLRGRLGIAIVVGIGLVLNLMLALTVVGLPFAALIWFALLIVGLVAGGKATVIIQQPNGTMTHVPGPTPYVARGWKSGVAFLIGMIVLGAIANNNSESHKLTRSEAAAITARDNPLLRPYLHMGSN